MSAIEPAGRRSERIPVSPQLALRVAILGGLAMAMFAIIFFRLWFLQVLSGEQYVQQANANRARDLPIAAPRGEILDREGKPLVASRTTNAVQIVPSALPPAGAPAHAALPAPRPAAGHERRARAGAGDQGAHGGALRAGDDQDRRRPRRADGARRAPERIPRRHAAAGVDPRLSRTARWPRRCSATSARSPKASSSCARSTASNRARSSARKASSTTTTATCADAGDPARGGQRGRAIRCPSNARADPAEGRLQPQGDARPAACSRRAKRRCCRASNTRVPAANRPTPARSWRSTRATARCSRWAPRRRSTRTSSPNR